jgi:hypothetical protein
MFRPGYFCPGQANIQAKFRGMAHILNDTIKNIKGNSGQCAGRRYGGNAFCMKSGMIMGLSSSG